jgi:hypothetical protein
VRCSECAVEVPALREFCPNCGTPTDPGLRRHRPGVPRPATGEQLKNNRKTVLIIAGGLLLTLGIAGKIHPFRFHHSAPPPPERIERTNGPVVITAEALANAYRKDADEADERYGDREMTVTGEFLRMVPDGYGSLDLRLNTSDPEHPLGVDVADVAIEDAKRLRPGQRVTVSCREMGEGGEGLWVRECAIQPGGEAGASAVPSVPAAPAAPLPPATDADETN